MDETQSNQIDSQREIDSKERERAEDMAEEYKNEDFYLHLAAGLKYVGVDKDGDKEYIGTNSQWSHYERLRDANY